MSMAAVLLLDAAAHPHRAPISLSTIRPTPRTVAIALQLFVIAALFQIFDGVQVIAAGALRGYRDTAVPMLIAAIGYWAIGFAGSWLLAFPLGFGAVGLWLGLALGLAVVAISLIAAAAVPARTQFRATETTVARGRGAARIEPALSRW